MESANRLHGTKESVQFSYYFRFGFSFFRTDIFLKFFFTLIRYVHVTYNLFMYVIIIIVMNTHILYFDCQWRQSDI